MAVTFENGQAHEMILEPYSNSPCNFVGELKNNPGTVAVTGCLDKPGDKMHITVLSDLNTKSNIYELDYNGHATALENPFKYQKEHSGKFPLKNREDGPNKCSVENEFKKHKDEMGDEEEDLSLEMKATLQASSAETWPNERYAYVKFGYDRTLKNQLESENTNFATWIDSVMTHVQTHYRHPSLPTKVQFKYDVTETIYKNQDMPSTNSLEAWSKIGQEDADPKVDLYAAFGKDPEYWGTVGLAWVGGACNDYIKTSMNEYRNTPGETASVVAHEMGHNFGMSHDFDDKHGGKDNVKCDHKGIMSYGDAPNAWSTCSITDFTQYYNSQEWGATCLKDWGSYCADICPGGKCRTTPDDLCSKIDMMGGCNGRYKSFLQPACQKSCGLCPDEEPTTEKAKTTAPAGSDCEDIKATNVCEKQKAKGKCTRGWWKKQCKKTCEQC